MTCRLYAPWLDPILLGAQDKKVAAPVVLFVLVILAWRSRRVALRTLLAGGIGFGLAMALATLMWAMIDRPRPSQAFDHVLTRPADIADCEAHPEAIPLRLDPARSPSFPSRHGLTIGVFVTVIWLASRRLGVLAAVYGALAALGRVYAGKHWPSDVVVGVLLGVLFGWACWRLVPAVLGRFGRAGWVTEPSPAPGPDALPPVAPAGEHAGVEFRSSPWRRPSPQVAPPEPDGGPARGGRADERTRGDPTDARHPGPTPTGRRPAAWSTRSPATGWRSSAWMPTASGPCRPAPGQTPSTPASSSGSPTRTSPPSGPAASGRGDPEGWPRATDRFLREHRTEGLGGTSFTLAYSLRDLLLGLGLNAHLVLGRNLVTEEMHAAVLLWTDDDGALLYDPSLLAAGSLPACAGARYEDPLGTVRLAPQNGPMMTVLVDLPGTAHSRAVYSIRPEPVPPHRFRQAWLASFGMGREAPIRIARRSGDVIHRWSERPGRLEIFTARGREQHSMPGAPTGELSRLFGIAESSLRSWFDGQRPSPWRRLAPGSRGSAGPAR